jgi:hypothetical protein
MFVSKNTKKFLSAIMERAIKTFAQTFVAAVGANAMGVFNSSSLDALKISASAAVLSIMTSIASAQFGAHGPSLASEVVVNDEVAGH